MVSVSQMNRTSWTNRLTLIAGLALVVFVTANVFAKDDDDKDWKVLGQAKVEKRADAGEIKVGGEEGVFKRIKLEVRGADVEFKKVTVVYASGADEQIDIRDEVKRGSQTRPIDLKGNRAIKKVLLVFKATGDTDRDARVVLLGNK
jgi:hypothetical protein